MGNKIKIHGHTTDSKTIRESTIHRTVDAIFSIILGLMTKRGETIRAVTTLNLTF